jgi:solute carrier family 50 protein (sugar transporter)
MPEIITATSPDILHLVLQVAGPIWFMGMQCASLRTAYQIMQKKTVGQLSNIPFLSLMTNSVVWSIYGSMKKDSTVFVPNASGVVAGIACVSIYHMYASSTNIRYYGISTSILWLSFILGWLGYVDWVGSLGVCMAIFLMGSPLSTLKTVIEQKNTNARPFYTSLATFMNALSWFLYGSIEAKDPMIIVPNFVGLLLASVQMSLFAIYGLPKEQAAEDSLPYASVPTTRAYEVVTDPKTEATALQPQFVPQYTK